MIQRHSVLSLFDKVKQFSILVIGAQIAMLGCFGSADAQEEYFPTTTSTQPAAWKLGRLRAGANRVEIPLPGKANDLRVGGNGQFWILHYKDKSILAIVDIAKQKIVKEISVAAKVCYAANAQHLMIALPSLNQLQKWDLHTLEKIKSVYLGDEGPKPEKASMGIGGQGPLALWNGTSIQMWDVSAMKRLKDLEAKIAKSYRNQLFTLMFSNDGTTFCGWNYRGVRVFRLGKSNVEFENKFNTRDGIKPTADGALILNLPIGVRDIDLEKIQLDGFEPWTMLYPSEDPRFFMSLTMKGKDLEISVFTTADRKKICTTVLKDVCIQHNQKWCRIGSEQLLRYMPEQGCFVCLTDQHDKLVIEKFDLLKAAKKTDPKQLHIISKPQPFVAKGSNFSYQIESLSNTKVTYKLDLGPEGMQVSEAGLMTWAIPKDFDSKSITATVECKNRLGRTLLHGVKIGVKSPDLVPPQIRPLGELATNNTTGRTRPSPRETDPKTAKASPPKKANNPDSAKKIVSNDKKEAGAGNSMKSGDDPIKKTVSGTETVIEFGRKFGSYCTGANGKLLIFHDVQANSLFVFDVVKRSITKDIKVEPQMVYAACRDKLLVTRPSTKTLERYDLKTFRREKTAKLTSSKLPTIARLGASGNGPLLLWEDGFVELWDIDKMQPIPPRGPRLRLEKQYDARISVSHDGKTFVGWIERISTQYFYVMRVSGNSTTVNQTNDYHGNSGRWMMPNFDGTLFTRYSAHVYGPDLVARRVESLKTSNIFPSHDPRFVVCAIRKPNRRANFDSQILICSANDFTQFWIGENKNTLCWPSMDGRFGRMGTEPRIKYYHSDKQLVILPLQNDRIVFRDVDILDHMKQTEPNFLHIVSATHVNGVLGQPFTYPIKTLSSSKALDFKISKGPKGMTVDKDGLIRWNIDQRPIGGAMEVEFTVSTKAGSKKSHSFLLDIRRDLGTKFAKSKNRGFDPADKIRLELPEAPISVTEGLNGRLLVLTKSHLAILKPDGWTVEKVLETGGVYYKILERKNYFVAIKRSPSEICILSKSNLSVLRSLKLGANFLLDLATHPTLPISYVSGRIGTGIPGYHFIQFDEETAKGRQNDSWIGKWIRVSPDGKHLLCGYEETYQNGSELMINPNNWDIVPTYGVLSWLLRYDLDRSGNAKLDEIKEKITQRGERIELSKDGKRLTLLSRRGHPMGSRNSAAWSTTDFREIPVFYPTKENGGPGQIYFHPYLPIVATAGPNGISFLNRETGEVQTGRVDLSELDSVESPRIHFSPDGQNLIVDGGVRGIRYFHKLALKLSAEERRLMKKLADQKPVLATREPRKKKTIALSEIHSLRSGDLTKRSSTEIARESKNSVVLVRCGDVSGTGFAIGSNGLVLTCAHCVPRDEVEVTYKNAKGNQVKVKATPLAVKEDLDLALLQLESVDDLKPVVLGVGHKVETGDDVWVIGNPAAGSRILDQTMTEGIVSNPSRQSGKQTLIQTSAAVNPGCSGGPLFNDKGQVVGLVVSKARIEGAGFAVTADLILEFLLDCTQREGKLGEVRRNWYNSDGKGPLDAIFIKSSGGKVSLKRVSDGRKFEIDVKGLSTIDREFLKKLAK